MEQDINAWWNEQVKEYQDNDLKQKKLIIFKDIARKNLAFEMNCKDYNELRNIWKDLNIKYQKHKVGKDSVWEMAKTQKKFYKTFDFTYTTKVMQRIYTINEIVNNIDISTINEDIFYKIFLAAAAGKVIFEEIIDLDIYFNMELIYDDEDFFFEEEKYYTLCDNLVREYLNKTEDLLNELKHIQKLENVMKRVLK